MSPAPRRARASCWQRTGAPLATHLVLLAGCAVMLFPYLWMLGTSFKPADETMLWPPRVLPIHWTWANYPRVMAAAPFVRYFLNSVVVSVGSTAMVIATSLLAGFIFGKYRFPGKRLLFLVILASAMFPFETYMIPLYLTMKSLGWINTYQGIAAPYLIMSFGIFLMRQHIAHGIPDELLDAARVDGASELRIFLRVIVPLCSSAIGAIGILAFIQAWSAFIWPLLMATNRSMYLMELGLSTFQFRFTTDYHLLSAASVLNTLPMLVAFIILRRRIMESVALTGLKG
ncbi:MAG TPA: carbohydrate ABC transporter permease [Methylomirabilota bacterium]|nr:carbohydrate ABC transporter permease [Methylomirabilota bacterium]